jgi:uncharacterized protein involved in outer membrane biogenesis
LLGNNFLLLVLGRKGVVRRFFRNLRVNKPQAAIPSVARLRHFSKAYSRKSPMYVGYGIVWSPPSEATMKRRWRRWLVGLLLVAFLFVVGGRLFLSSSYVRGRVAASLEQLYGGSVRVGSADIGMRRTVLSRVELFEKGDGPNQQPWMSIDRLEADLSLWDVLRGRQPTQVVLSGVTVRLRFDAEGKLLTKLPSGRKSTGPPARLPDVQLTDGRVLLVDNTGRQLTFDKVEATLKSAGTSHAIAGSGQNAAWGHWLVAGKLDLANDSIDVTLKSSTTVHVTQAMLERLPLVAANVWQDVQLEGDTPIVVELSIKGVDSSVAVTLAPQRTHLHIPAIDLDTTDTSGTVEIAQGKIKLRKLKALFAGGALAGDIDLDFPPTGLIVDILDLSVDNVDVAALPRQWSIPPQLTGRLFAAAKVRIAIGNGPVRTQGTGRGEIRQAALAGQALRQGIIVHLTDNKGASCLVVEGNLPAGDLASLAEAFDVKLAPEVKGRLGLQFRTELPLDTIADPLTYRATGNAILAPLSLAGISVEKVTASWAYQGGALQLHEVHAGLPGGPLTGRVAVRLQAPFAFEATFQAENIDLATLEKLDTSFRPPFAVRGRLTGTAQLQGKLRPFVISTAGTLQAHDVNAAGWTASVVKAQWHSDPQQLLFEQIQASAYGGSIRGTAVLPLNASGGGTFQFQLGDLDIAKVVYERLGTVLRVDGKTDGFLAGTIAPQVGDRPRDISVHLDLRAPSLGVERGTAEQVALNLEYRHGLVQYRVEGRALGGSVQLQGQLGVIDRQQGQGTRPGHLRLHHLEVARLLDLLGQRQEQLPVRGTVDADLTFRFDGNSLVPVARGHVVLNDLAWQDQLVVPAAQAELVIQGGELTLRDVSATVGKGVLSGKVVVNLEHRERSWFQLALDSAELADLLQPWPELAKECQGTLGLRLQGTLGREWHGSADAVLARAKLGGVAVGEWRLPVRWSLAPAEGRGQLEIHDSHAQVAQGTATLQLSVCWGTGLRLDGQAKFTGIDLRQAFPGAKLGSGRANGQLDVTGEYVRGFDDLKASLHATLVQTQALQLPVLRQVGPILGFQSTSTFQNGELHARLARSVVRIERLTFYQGPLQLFAAGDVTLQGRVQIDVTANTGKLTNVAAALGWRVPVTGGIAREMLAKATTALSPRLLHLHVRGTLHEPTIQVVPLPLLTEQALRFFAGL